MSGVGESAESLRRGACVRAKEIDTRVNKARRVREKVGDHGSEVERPGKASWKRRRFFIAPGSVNWVLGKVFTDEEEGRGPFRAVHTVGTGAQR